MSARLEMLEQELADTLEAARLRRGLPPLRAPVGDLARDLVGQPRAPKTGACCYCGAPVPNRTVCDAHEDLTDLDPGTSAVVATSTQANGPGRIPLSGSARPGPGGDSR